MSIRKERPSVIWGVRTAIRLWPLVVLVWLSGLVFFLPASVVLQKAAARSFGRVPEGFDLPAGDGAILATGLLRDVADTLSVSLVFGIVLAWAWTVLWHAGVARISVWEPESTSKASRVLGLGLGAWWRYCRLSLVALVGLVALLIAIWLPLLQMIKTAFGAMAEGRMIFLIGTGIFLSPVAKILVWAATLRGAWELARPDARSSAFAWFRGLVGVFRQPVSTLGVLLTLGVLQVALALVPLVAPLFVPSLRGTSLGSTVAGGATLAAAFFLVALFAAFAPISGVVFRSSDDEE